MGAGFQTGSSGAFEIGPHNGWQDLWAKGGLSCMLTFLIGQAVILARLIRAGKSG